MLLPAIRSSVSRSWREIRQELNDNNQDIYPTSAPNNRHLKMATNSGGILPVPANWFLKLQKLSKLVDGSSKNKKSVFFKTWFSSLFKLFILLIWLGKMNFLRCTFVEKWDSVDSYQDFVLSLFFSWKKQQKWG